MSPRILPIADRSLNGLIGSQVVGDLYRIYTVAQRDGIEFNLAYIPDDYDIGAQESFDQEAMKRLFQLGYEWARRISMATPAPRVAGMIRRRSASPKNP